MELILAKLHNKKTPQVNIPIRVDTDLASKMRAGWDGEHQWLRAVMAFGRPPDSSFADFISSCLKGSSSDRGCSGLVSCDFYNLVRTAIEYYWEKIHGALLLESDLDFEESYFARFSQILDYPVRKSARKYKEYMETIVSPDGKYPLLKGTDGKYPSLMQVSPIGYNYCYQIRMQMSVSGYYLGQIALATKVYRAVEGRYPDTLSQLTPKYLEALPMDPISGEPFAIRAEADGVVVHSSMADSMKTIYAELGKDCFAKKDDGAILSIILAGAD